MATVYNISCAEFFLACTFAMCQSSIVRPVLLAICNRYVDHSDTLHSDFGHRGDESIERCHALIVLPFTLVKKIKLTIAANRIVFSASADEYFLQLTTTNIANKIANDSTRSTVPFFILKLDS